MKQPYPLLCRFLALFCLSLTVFTSAVAQTCAAPGKEGPCSLSGIINSYHSGSNGTVTAGATVIPLNSITGQRTSTRGLQVGDLVLVMQMQDSAVAANAGLHEYASIISIAGNNITLNRPLTNSYVQSVGTAPIRVRTFQVIYVPQCSTATVAAANTVTADRWTINATNGQGTGGVVALDVAGSLAINGTITVAGAGFRGGAGINGAASRAGGLFTDGDYNFNTGAVNGALKGEGTVGTPIAVFDGTATPLNYAALIGQGYAAGAGGRAAQGNAGGGGNDGTPATGANQFNSGGGGGGNGGAGGNGGFSWSVSNDAGGRGAVAVVSAATRLVMGGGGGAGSSNNNGVANAITVWPPIVDATTRAIPPTTGTANGASGPISSSGASGGGIVLIRTNVLAPSTGSVVADGYTAYNNSGGSESGGAGGAGGSIYISALSGNGAGLATSANGGGGGYSNYFDHGPGGGGGGGYIQTSLSSSAISVAGGGNGFDGCCGGVQGNGSPKPYSAQGGIGSIAALTVSPPTGNNAGAVCMPVLTTLKTTTTPVRTLPAQTTAQYVISVTNANTSGIAYGLSVTDGLPTPFGLQTVGATATSVFSGTLTNGLSPTATNQSGNTATATFGVQGGTAANSYTLAPGGRITLTYTVNVNTTTIPQTFQNSASATFTDPTRSTGNTAAVGGNPSVSPGGTYASGAAVGGSNYASGSSTGEDVRLTGSVNLSVTKTNNLNAVTAGATISYTVTFANLTPSLAVSGVFIQDTASAGLNCVSATCSNNGTSATCPAPYNPGPASASTLLSGFTLTNPLPANSSLSFVITCGVTASGQ
jgi:uncharacterized repeat protein (TIGR01451 family)